MNRVRTDFLFARPSFWSGVARVLDLFGTFDCYNDSRSSEEADARAMYADWRMVGQDIMDQTAHFEKVKRHPGSRSGAQRTAAAR